MSAICDTPPEWHAEDPAALQTPPRAPSVVRRNQGTAYRSSPTTGEVLDLVWQEHGWVRRGSTWITRTNCAAVVLMLYLFTVFSDFTVVENAEPYTSASKCLRPLLIFEHSTLRRRVPHLPSMLLGRTPIAWSPQQNTTLLSELAEATRVSACYLEQYPDLLTCITPAAYGTETVRLVSLRRSEAPHNTLHLWHPVIQHNPGAPTVTLSERSTMFPHARTGATTRRAQAVTVAFYDTNTTETKLHTVRLTGQDAFCVQSGVDILNGIVPGSFLMDVSSVPKVQ